MSVKEKFFLLLFPTILSSNVPAKIIYYCGKIFGETDFIDLVTGTDWSMTLSPKIPRFLKPLGIIRALCFFTFQSEKWFDWIKENYLFQRLSLI